MSNYITLRGNARSETERNLMADAAEHAGVPRFIHVSCMGAGQRPPTESDGTWAAYIAAKSAGGPASRSRPGKSGLFG
ncbi:hypothetical protein [Sphaerisporangium perillae]|uniref:hypothetical protein n=1 Tax=Sphaerisporangium perillae TaxID=2935860 RepID=UPI002010BF25|nr:hypothetical protein [Sphaerisporangium perillae]